MDTQNPLGTPRRNARDSGRIAGTLHLAKASAGPSEIHLRTQLERLFQVAPTTEHSSLHVDAVQIGSAYFGELAVHSALFVRSLPMIGGPEMLLVLAVTGGLIEGTTAHGPTIAGPGEVCVVDMQETVTMESDHCRVAVCLFPLAMLSGEFRGGDIHGRVLPASSALTQILHQTILSTVGYYRDPQGDRPENLAAPLAAFAGACLRSAAGFARNAPAAEAPSPLVLIKRHIDAHLDDPAMSVDSVARQLGMARASLYRQFEPLGGIATYIRTRRLQRARLELTKARPGPFHLSSVAAQAGFKSAGEFSRIFRAAYGLSPRQYRLQSLPVGQGTSPGRGRNRPD